jgi:hypothetical protein
MKNWKPIHTKMVKMRMEGSSLGQIAEKANVSKGMVAFIVKSPYFQERLDACKAAKEEGVAIIKQNFLKEAKDLLDRNLVPAAQRIVELSQYGESKDRIQLDAAQAILDRAGLAKHTVVEEVSRNYTPEEIASARKTILEMESITARVTTTQSRFVLRQPDGTTPEATVRDTDAAREILPTSSDRPETSAE